MASFFVWKKRDFIQVLCSEIVNFSSMVSLWIIFSILGAVQHAVEGHFFQNYARNQKRKSAKICSRVYLNKKQKNKKNLTAHTDSIILLPLMRGRYMNGYQRPEAGMQ